VVMGPADEAAGTGRYGSVRASHADRDRVVDLLKTAFVQGRLAKDEFDLRLSRVLTSRTYADLDALLLTSPPRCSDPSSRSRPGKQRPRRPGNRRKGRSSRPGHSRLWCCRAWRWV
jgi:hypothetical protein